MGTFGSPKEMLSSLSLVEPRVDKITFLSPLRMIQEMLGSSDTVDGKREVAGNMPIQMAHGFLS